MSEKMDVLNRGEFIDKLKTLVNMLTNKKQGCCFGIDGAWGSGKSFVLEKFESDIRELLLEETADNKYFVFHYDCWKYDYYDEPAIAIIAAMLDATDKELSMFSDETRAVAKAGWQAARDALGKIAGEFCKNKIGIDLVELASDAADKYNENKADANEFDSLYGFKRALEEARTGIQEIAERKTVIIVVDELDRCLPTYSIKVLERLHHIFNELQNVIVIVSMDKNQLEHSIKEIYGEINVDIYLRKFISFKVNLDKGNASNYFDKYASYISMFNIHELGESEIIGIEGFFKDIMSKLGMREQERIFQKASIIHDIIANGKMVDCSFMVFEILFLTVAFRTLQTKWLLDTAYQPDIEKKIGKSYYDKLKEYRKKAVNPGHMYNNNAIITNTWLGKAFFWLANVHDKYDNGVCMSFYYGLAGEEDIRLIREFVELINIIDND